MNLIIGGDVVPENNVGDLFKSKKINEILGDKLFNIWETADYKLFNLESPLTSSDVKIKKAGPCIKCDKEVIKGIKAMAPTCICLANNHIMDYSSSGLNDTIKVLNDNDISWVGVGKNIDSVSKSFVLENNKKRIAIYNCCEKEFSYATSSECGANPFDEYSSLDDLKKLKKNNDYVIVIYHGGKEYYRYPSPDLQKRCRKMVEYGANLVVCQHSHCVGCKEEYLSGTIIYGQGNFIFNRNNNDYWNTSLLINLNLDNYEIDYIPIGRTENGTRKLNDEDSKKVITDFNKRSEEIKNPEFVFYKYKKFSLKYRNEYLIMLSGSRFIYKLMNKLGFDLSKFFKLKYTSIINAIECESHRELAITCLKTILEEGNKDEK